MGKARERPPLEAPYHDILRLRINGRVFSFKLPPDGALSASDRIREELDDIADYGFADEE